MDKLELQKMAKGLSYLDDCRNPVYLDSGKYEKIFRFEC